MAVSTELCLKPSHQLWGSGTRKRSSPAYHRRWRKDVKSSNVMPDERFRARLGDIGLARKVEHGKSPDATVNVGTMGYLAQEYLLSGSATEKTDVFSFGALVVSGQRPIDGNEGRNLVEWVWRLHGEGWIMVAVDERMGGEFEEGEVQRALFVGLVCLSPDAVARPVMCNVIQMLADDRTGIRPWLQAIHEL